mgnify:FL=1
MFPIDQFSESNRTSEYYSNIIIVSMFEELWNLFFFKCLEVDLFHMFSKSLVDDGGLEKRNGNLLRVY